MATVQSIGQGLCLSLSQIASEFGVSRETARKRLAAEGVDPVGKRGGHPVYRLRDVLAPVLELGQERADPDTLKPFERESYYRGELAKLKYQQETRELIPRVEAEAELARVVSVFVQGVETLPDVVERDVGAPPQVLSKIETEVDRLRDRLYLTVTEGTLAHGAEAPAEETTAPA